MEDGRTDEDDDALDEVFKTLLVEFERLHKRMVGGEPGLKERVERLRKGMLLAEGLCDVDLASPTFRYLTPEGAPWYGEKDFEE